MKNKNGTPGEGPGVTTTVAENNINFSNFTIPRRKIQFHFKTDLPGLLAQADERQRRAESRRDIDAAVAHFQIWLAIHSLIFGGTK